LNLCGTSIPLALCGGREGSMTKPLCATVTGLISLTVLTGLVGVGTVAIANDRPPADPGQYVTKVEFTVAWARRLVGFHTLADLQRLAGSKGTISDRHLEGSDPNVSFQWRSQPSNGRVGYMKAIVRPSPSTTTARSFATSANRQSKSKVRLRLGRASEFSLRNQSSVVILLSDPILIAHLPSASFITPAT
jgi:hypothetical protein